MDRVEELRSEIDTNNARIIEFHKQIQLLEQRNRTLTEQMLEKENDTMNKFSLNNHQKSAVNGIEGNSIIIACPGSGKTHTLVAKIVYLINQHEVDPDKVVLITFTKKASQEMINRLRQHLGSKRLLHTGTIHGLAYRTLQKYRGINYTILDETESYRSVRERMAEISKEMKLDEEVTSLLHKRIPWVYEAVCSQYPTPLLSILKSMNLDKYRIPIMRALDAYEDFKQNHHYLDFSDLMIKFLNFLQAKESNEFVNGLSHIFFDEYQDVNGIQDAILREMNRSCRNLTVVGDDSQAIYAFRGSEVKYILNFHEAYPEVNTYRLEINYRSTPEIVTFCNAIIDKNYRRLEKSMVANYNGHAEKPIIIGFGTDQDEIKYVVGRIKALTKAGMSMNDVAVITRKNRQLDIFELELIKNRINYVKSKGIGILDRVHIKDFLAFIVVMVNPLSIVHWKRILMMVPKVGETTTKHVVEWKTKKSIMERIIQGFPDYKIRVLLAPLRAMLKKMQQIQQHGKEAVLEEICNCIIQFLTPMIQQQAGKDNQQSAEEKIDDLITLRGYISDAESLEKFLTDIHLEIDLPSSKQFSGNQDEDDATYLLLSTIHGSKGLEWDHVFLCGASSDHLPSYRPQAFYEEFHDVEEERRLFYVGCSRARRGLEITLSYDRRHRDSVYVSPFIAEIDPELYVGANLLMPARITKGNVTSIVSNYVLIKSITPMYPLLKDLRCDYRSHYHSDPKTVIYRHGMELLYGSFIDNLIVKMVYQRYKEELPPLSVPAYQRHGFKKDKHYHRYIDPNNDWRDSIDAVLSVTKRCYRRGKFSTLLDWLTSPGQVELYEKIEKAVIQMVERAKGKEGSIQLHENLSFGEIMGEADMVIGKTLVEIKTSKECIISTRNVLQAIMYRYMLMKRNVIIRKIVFFNPLLGESYVLHTYGNWKMTAKVWRKITSD